MIETLRFTIYAEPIPQGSSRGFPIRRVNGTIGVSITSDNPRLKGFRHAAAQAAMMAVANHGGQRPYTPKHTPVRLEMDFYFVKPPSVKKTRIFPVVKPDLDKCCRAVFDACKGILYTDDAEVVELSGGKFYGSPARVEVTMRTALEDGPGLPAETILPEVLHGIT